MIIEKAGKKPFNPEGVTWDICVEMSFLRDFMVGYIISIIILPLRG
ncbi:MAG: hypothetical protein JETT_0540 [Candidatus Jettenia ecosi]|uniref:Uncharacterized protein n=1 Tax=Candidatus Jettenia ecosi TaxID=2494326 RepID=A0A533QEC2_9BACT|nr:MAG: hypothetical protein JETT_0540 [Candidatus Jettenia ecosi]